MRQSPDESATLFKIGTKKKGNDGNTWIIKKASNGVKRWTKLNEVNTLADMLKIKHLNNKRDIDKYRKLKADLSEKEFNKVFMLLVERNLRSPTRNQKAITIKDKMLIIDPSQSLHDNAVNMYKIYKVLPGKWNLSYRNWIGNVPNILVATHSKYNDDMIYDKYLGYIGVDGGRVLITDLNDYPDTDYVTQIDWNVDNKFKKNKNMYCVQSGYGDGRYSICAKYVNSKIVGILVVFIV
jgi:hypothetical protein